MMVIFISDLCVSSSENDSDCDRNVWFADFDSDCETDDDMFLSFPHLQPSRVAGTHKPIISSDEPTDDRLQKSNRFPIPGIKT